MRTPFDYPAPSNIADSVSEYARDLAWGVDNNVWDDFFTQYDSVDKSVLPNQLTPQRIDLYLASGHIHYDRFSDESIKLSKRFIDKWFQEISPPRATQLKRWNYINYLSMNRAHDASVELTAKAFDLLKEPYKSPNIFISYSHKYSSALALAIEARLKYLGNHNIFVDKSIPGSHNWNEVIERNIKTCDYFVLLVHSDVFESRYIRQEFELAVSEGKTIYPFYHHGVKPSKFEHLKDTQGIVCEGDISAKTFETAINELLFWMGYPTY